PPLPRRSRISQRAATSSPGRRPPRPSPHPPQWRAESSFAAPQRGHVIVVGVLFRREGRILPLLDSTPGRFSEGHHTGAAGPRLASPGVMKPAPVALVAALLAALPAAAQTGPCAPLPPPSGTIIDVTPAQVSQLASIVAGAPAGATIRLANGNYA